MFCFLFAFIGCFENVNFFEVLVVSSNEFVFLIKKKAKKKSKEKKKKKKKKTEQNKKTFSLSKKSVVNVFNLSFCLLPPFLPFLPPFHHPPFHHPPFHPPPFLSPFPPLSHLLLLALPVASSSSSLSPSFS